nr:MAG TPA: hypothetical protein [Caudoviricetes sp.]
MVGASRSSPEGRALFRGKYFSALAARGCAGKIPGSLYFFFV